LLNALSLSTIICFFLSRVKIANEISERYYQYDGFVVLHGTDTMSFTSSALSFLLQNVNKTVVVTGSQVFLNLLCISPSILKLPLCETITDATNNLLGALRIAGNYYIPEVSYFHALISIIFIFIFTSFLLTPFQGYHVF
jgi:L-asparaginase/Glu-tRNA(Gln) amidotransferase subunit D